MVVPLIVAGAAVGAGAGALVAGVIADGSDSNPETAPDTKPGIETGAQSDTEIGTDTESESSMRTIDESDGSNQFRSVVEAFLADLTRQAALRLIKLTCDVGTDRYAEAELVEQLHAKEYARQVGGTVTDSSASVYAPDGGVDRTVKLDEGVTKIQSKHHAGQLPESVLEEYGDQVDVIASSNGTSTGADPGNYGLEEFTMQDWSARAKIRLKCRRFFNGLIEGLRGVQTWVKKIMNVCRGLSARLTSAVKWVNSLTASAARATVGWVLRLTTLQQAGLAAGVVTVALLAWRWVSTDSGFSLHLPGERPA